MPHPWPECEANAQARKLRRRPVRAHGQQTGRVALAVSVALFFVGYLTLAGYFLPQPQTTPVEPAVRDSARIPMPSQEKVMGEAKP